MPQVSRTVLLVDDSPEDRELYRRHLQRDPDYSYTIFEAELGQQGLALWRQHQPDVVILDYRLPDLDGLDFLTQLSAANQPSYLPVIVVTGQGSEAIAVQTIKAGAQDYLVKEQITADGLQWAVNHTIEAVQLRRQVQQGIERERIVSQMALKIHQTLDLEEILQTTVTEVRQYLQTDRVLIFRLQSDGWGTVITESVGSGWIPLLSTSYNDPCLSGDYLEPFRQGLVASKSDIHDGSIEPCHMKLLNNLQVQANLVIPIQQNDQLWGMLIAHHCISPRQWQTSEITLLKDLTIQLGIALKQAELYQQAQTELAERRQVEADLKVSEERFRTSVENMLDCFAIYRAVRNDQGQIVDFEVEYINDAACLDSQRTREEHLSRSLCDLLPTYRSSGLFDEYCQVVETGKPLFKENLIYEDHFGQNRLNKAFDIQVAKYGDGYVATWRDITERKQTEAERELLLQREQAAREEAEQANRIKDEFLAILSHELRSPLNPILGWTNLLQTRHLDSAKTAQALAIIERNAKLQTQLIDDLLDTARILRGKLELKMVPVDLVFVIESAMDTVSAAAVAKNILLNPVLPRIGQVSGDATRLQQIVWNLLANAIKFTPEGGRVEIRLEAIEAQSSEGASSSISGRERADIPSTDLPLNPPTHAQIAITDNGRGINPDFLPHLFESFRQEDASTTRSYGGLGLGLAIVRYLVEAHGGTVGAFSEGEEKGATFTVQLPLLNAAPAPDPPPAEIIHKLDLTGLRILTVDDEPDACDLITTVLTEYGAEVLTLSSAKEVLENFAAFQPDVLVSDIGMPDMDGYMLLQHIRALEPEAGGQVTAIAVTAYAREEDRRHALDQGFQGHIAKPLEPERLASAIWELTRS
jgi:signal transduction histidine kinase/DNA-binding response OmpR family regulator